MLNSTSKSLRAENMHSTMKNKGSLSMSDGTNKKSTTKTLTKKKKKRRKKKKLKPVVIETAAEPVEKQEEKVAEELQRQQGAKKKKKKKKKKKIQDQPVDIEAAAKIAEQKMANRICVEAKKKKKKIREEFQQKQEKRNEHQLKIDIVHRKILMERKNRLNGSVYAGGAKESNIIALDCEMVGVGPGGVRKALARVSIVNFSGDVIIDKFVKPKEKIEDYRTIYSGISEGDLENAEAFDSVQKQIRGVIRGKIVVAHSIHHDLKALRLYHPIWLIRDTGNYKGLSTNGRRSLKNLCEEKLGLEIQSGSHDSVEDARATLLLYKVCSRAWEKDIKA